MRFRNIEETEFGEKSALWKVLPVRKINWHGQKVKWSKLGLIQKTTLDMYFRYARIVGRRNLDKKSVFWKIFLRPKFLGTPKFLRPKYFTSSKVPLRPKSQIYFFKCFFETQILCLTSQIPCPKSQQNRNPREDSLREETTRSSDA